MNVSIIQKVIERNNEVLRLNAERQKPGLTALITSGLSSGRRDVSSLAKSRFKSFDVG